MFPFSILTGYAHSVPLNVVSHLSRRPDTAGTQAGGGQGREVLDQSLHVYSLVGSLVPGALRDPIG